MPAHAKMTAFIIAMLLLCGSVFADCGDETWLLKPPEIDGEALKRTTAVVTLNAERTSPQEVTVYDLKKGAFTALNRVSVSKVQGVSRAPTCRPEPRHPLDGLRLPVVEVRGEYFLVVLNARFGSSIWIRPDEFGPKYVVQISSFSRHAYINTAFNPGPEGHRVYREPSEGRVYTLLPMTFGVLQVLEQRGDFIHIGMPGGERAVEPIGWIRVHNEKGQLTIWPWYYDDC